MSDALNPLTPFVSPEALPPPPPPPSAQSLVGTPQMAPAPVQHTPPVMVPPPPPPVAAVGVPVPGQVLPPPVVGAPAPGIIASGPAIVGSAAILSANEPVPQAPLPKKEPIFHRIAERLSEHPRAVLATLFIAVAATGAGTAWGLLSYINGHENLHTAPVAETPSTQREVPLYEPQPLPVEPSARIGMYQALLQAQLEVEAEILPSIPFNTGSVNWSAWEKDVSFAKLTILGNQTEKMKEIAAAYQLSVEDLDQLLRYMLYEGRWETTPLQTKYAVADWYYRNGIRFYLQGGDENFLQAYYELQVAAKLDQKTAAAIITKIAPVISEDHRRNAAEFADTLIASLKLNVDEPAPQPAGPAGQPAAAADASSSVSSAPAESAALGNERPTWISEKEPIRPQYRSLLPASLLGN